MLVNKLNLKLLQETYCVAFPSCTNVWVQPHCWQWLCLAGKNRVATAHPNLKGTALASGKLSVDLGGFGDLKSEGTSCFR